MNSYWMSWRKKMSLKNWMNLKSMKKSKSLRSLRSMNLKMNWSNYLNMMKMNWKSMRKSNNWKSCII